MKKVLFVLLFMCVCSIGFGQCVGEIKDVIHQVENSGSQFKFITQYTCNDKIVDVQGQPCNSCTQGNRVGGDKDVLEAKEEAEEAVRKHAENLNGRYGTNSEKIEEEKTKIYAESKGVNVKDKDIVQIKGELKTILDAEREAKLQALQDNVTNNLDAIKSATIGYKVTVDKYTETFMDKKIEVSTDEKITVSAISAVSK